MWVRTALGPATRPTFGGAWRAKSTHLKKLHESTPLATSARRNTLEIAERKGGTVCSSCQYFGISQRQGFAQALRR